jgi:cytoskeletal protein RodZ
MNALGTIVELAGTVLVVYAIWQLVKRRKQKTKKTMLWMFVSLGFILGLGGNALIENSPQQKAADTRTAAKKVAAKKAASSSKRVAKQSSLKASSSRAAKEASAKASSSAAKAESKKVAATQSANEEKNYQQFLKAVANVPTATQGVITAANYNEDTETLTLILTDDALGYTPAQLKAVTKSAWDAGHRLYDQYSPMPESKTGTGWVVIQDSAGDQLAKSSFFGGFKYTGE